MTSAASVPESLLRGVGTAEKALVTIMAAAALPGEMSLPVRRRESSLRERDHRDRISKAYQPDSVYGVPKHMPPSNI